MPTAGNVVWRTLAWSGAQYDGEFSPSRRDNVIAKIGVGQGLGLLAPTSGNSKAPLTLPLLVISSHLLLRL